MRDQGLLHFRSACSTRSLFLYVFHFVCDDRIHSGSWIYDDMEYKITLLCIVIHFEAWIWNERLYRPIQINSLLPTLFQTVSWSSILASWSQWAAEFAEWSPLNMQLYVLNTAYTSYLLNRKGSCQCARNSTNIEYSQVPGSGSLFLFFWDF